jgi:hypothetical protein
MSGAGEGNRVCGNLYRDEKFVIHGKEGNVNYVSGGFFYYDYSWANGRARQTKPRVLM